MCRSLANRGGLWLVVAIAAVVNLVPTSGQAQITFLNTWGSIGSGNNQLDFPEGVAVGSTGTVYVADTDNQRVQVFSLSGVYQSTIGTGSPGSGNNQFNDPEGVAVDPTGDVYVVDTSNQRIQVFSPSGVYQSTIGTTGSSGTGNNQFDFPSGVAVGSTGTVYVADYINQRIQVFSPSGVYQSTIGTTGSSGTGSNQFDFPEGVAIGPTGTIYVADKDNQRVQVFNSSGVYQSTIGTGSYGSGNNQFKLPYAVAVGSTGTVYVADAGNDRVQVFNSSGVYQSTIGTGSYGSGNNQFADPDDVAVTPTGMVYVADTVNNRIVRLFDPGSWVSGTNTFTDPTVGPTSVNVGPGQIMGTSLTLTSAMGLVVNAANVNSGGFLTQAGGSLSASSGLSVSAGGSFTYQNGSLSIGELAVNGGFFQATQGGQLSAPSVVSIGPDPSAEMLLDGGTSLTAETVSMQGGLLVLGNATVSVTNASNPCSIFSGEVRLQNANTSIINTLQLLNEGGLLDGSGQINGQLQNYIGAEVSVVAGQTMTITGAVNLNNGLMSLTSGTFHFTQDLTNNGTIQGIGTLRVDGGLTNNGMLALAGSSYVFGTVANQSTGIIHLSGNTPNTFFGTLNNNGAINIDAGASGIFLGAVMGTGTITNAGAALVEANSSFSTVSGSGSTTLTSAVTLNANTFAQAALTLQLGGDTAGSYSKLDVAGALSLGGTLTVNLINGFAPASGDSFDLLDWGTLNGHFSSVSLPELSAGLAWNSTQLYNTGVLSVVSLTLLPGDFNHDSHVNAADFMVMEEALANLNLYKTFSNLTDAQLMAIGDINGDGVFNNADLQALLIFLQAGGGSISTVPEPSSLLLLALGGFALAVRRRIEKKSRR